MVTHAFKFTALMLISLACASHAAAADACKAPASKEKSIALVKNFYEAFNTKNKAQLDVVLAPNWIDVPAAPGQAPGRDGMKGAMDHYFESFPDFTLKNEDFIVSGNKVVVRSVLHATQRGDFSSIKASGKPIEVMTIDIHEICNGKVVQTWHLEDWLAGMFQMGVLPLQK